MAKRAAAKKSPAPLLDDDTNPGMTAVDSAPPRRKAAPRPRPVVADLTPRQAPPPARSAAAVAATRPPVPNEAALPRRPYGTATPAHRALPATKKTPFYPRLLRLRHLKLNGWQRAALADGPVAVSVLVVLADVATPWTLLVLPATVAAVVKSHDWLAGLLERRNSETAPTP